MVKLEGISVEKLHEKLKIKRIAKTAKKIFGGNVAIDESINSLYLKEKPNLREILSISWPKTFLSIYPDKNKFILNDRNYFDKTFKFATEYERLFGVEPILVTEYDKKSP